MTGCVLSRDHKKMAWRLGLAHVEAANIEAFKMAALIFAEFIPTAISVEFSLASTDRYIYSYCLYHSI